MRTPRCFSLFAVLLAGLSDAGDSLAPTVTFSVASCAFARPSGAVSFEESLASAMPDLREGAAPFAQARRAPARAPSITLASAPSLVIVEDPWTDAVREHRYGMGPPSRAAKVINGLLLEDPLFPTPLLAPLLDRFPAEMARKIAGSCLAGWSGWWDRIGCVSRGVERELSKWTFKMPSTACKMHAVAFNDAFAALGLKSAVAQTIDASGGAVLPTLGDGGALLFQMHVANVILVQDAHGRVFSYVIDSGWFPGKLFPLNDLAVSLHDRDHDGKTDHAALPEISAHPVSKFFAR